MWDIPLFELNYDKQELDAVSQVIKSGWLTMGERTLEFESSFARILGEDVRCTAVSSGTAALHTALMGLDIEPGDEVIVPAMTFVADINVVRMVGARPVLADASSLSDFNVSVDTIEGKLSKKTKAIIVVHFAGFPCEMTAISELCKKKGIHLIEDVAHAPGASINGKMCGTWGDFGCFSFFSNKNISVGEGGMICSFSEECDQKAKYLRSHGMTTLTLDRHKGRALTYDVALSGLNYRIDEIRAALGVAQLNKLIIGNDRRAALATRYHAQLEEASISIPFRARPTSEVSAHHIYPILLPKEVDRKKVMQKLKAKGIQSSIHYPSMCDFSAFGGLFDSSEIPVAQEISQRELTLPLFPTMRDDQVDMVASALMEVI